MTHKSLLNLLDRFENAAGVYERSDSKADREELHAARRAIMERDAELVKALEPFAKVGRLIDGHFGPALFANDEDAFQSGCAWTEDGERKTLTWGNFRAATAALRSPQQNT